jgi:hypothetical protein
MAHFLGPANHSFFSIFFFFLHRLTQAELLLLLVAVIDRLLPSSSIQHHRSPPRVLQIFLTTPTPHSTTPRDIFRDYTTAMPLSWTERNPAPTPSNQGDKTPTAR